MTPQCRRRVKGSIIARSHGALAVSGYRPPVWDIMPRIIEGAVRGVGGVKGPIGGEGGHSIHSGFRASPGLYADSGEEVNGA